VADPIGINTLPGHTASERLTFLRNSLEHPEQFERGRKRNGGLWVKSFS